MKDIYYTPGDNLIFWVSGYDVMNTNDRVLEGTKELLKKARQFAKAVDCKLEDVKSFHNKFKGQFEYHRIFYIKKTHGINLPKGTFIYTGTTRKWVDVRDDDGLLIETVMQDCPFTIGDVIIG